jgi:hypothetical protein
VELSGTDAGSIFYYRQDTGRFELGETTGLEEEVLIRFRKLDIAAAQTALGEAIAKREPLQIPDGGFGTPRFRAHGHPATHARRL